MQTSWRLDLGVRTRTLHSRDRLRWLLGHVYRLADLASALGPLLYDSLSPLSRHEESLPRLSIGREFADHPGSGGNSWSSFPRQTPPQIQALLDLACLRSLFVFLHVDGRSTRERSGSALAPRQ